MFKFSYLLFIPALILLNSCSEFKPQANKINTYHIPWGQASGKVVFQDVVIDDLKDPYLMEGASARVIVSGDYSHYGGPQGEIAKPNMVRSDGVLVPTDVKSIAAVTSYAHMYHLRKLDESLGIKSFLKWPRTVGVNTLERVGANFYNANNAFYTKMNDTINILPYVGDKHPLYINGAVIAHEHFHALYNSQVDWFSVFENSEMAILTSKGKDFKICENEEFYNSIAIHAKMNALNIIDSKLENINPINRESLRKIIQQTNFVISRAWDEGSADVYAHFYSKNDDFLSDSIKSGGYRKLTGSYSKYFRSPMDIVFNLKHINNFRCENSKINYLKWKQLGIESEERYFYLLAADYGKFFRKLQSAKILKSKYGANVEKKILLALIASLKDIDKYIQSNFLDQFLSPIQPIDFVLKKLKVEREPEICRLVEELYRSPYCTESPSAVAHEI
ncbi:MAG: hypothetical protein H6625_06520 [Bdellovibrionaceae bacterium]|nr:hypothetical protein [Pseudobdellovibrionaceae bacterium]